MRLVLLAAGLLLLVSSCVNTKKFNSVWIPGGQIYYDREITGDFSHPPFGDSIYKKVLKKGARAILPATNSTGNSTPSTITFLDDTLYAETILSWKATSDNKEIQEGTFFPLSTDLWNHIKDSLYCSPYFRYVDIRPIIQVITVPFKYRPRLNASVNSTATSNFDLAITYGWQFTNYRYRKYSYHQKKGYTDGQEYTTNWSFTPGILLGPTVVDLDSTSTNGKVMTARSVVGLTWGGYLVFGYNSFNFGMALGVDQTWGAEPSQWIYKGRPWFGLVIAVNLFK